MASAFGVHVLGIGIVKFTIAQFAIEGEYFALHASLDVLATDRLMIGRVAIVVGVRFRRTVHFNVCCLRLDGRCSVRVRSRCLYY